MSEEYVWMNLRFVLHIMAGGQLIAYGLWALSPLKIIGFIDLIIFLQETIYTEIKDAEHDSVPYNGI